MDKEVISDRQGIAIGIVFILGTASMLGLGIEAKKDLWIAIIISIFAAFLIVCIYARLYYIFEKDLFDIVEICFGKFIGRVIILLYIWYTVHLGSLILRDIGEFTTNLGVTETPMIIPMIFMTIVSIFATKKGIKIICRCSEFFVPLLIIFLFVAILLLIPEMDINNIFPILENGITPVIRGAFSALSFPFAETIALTMIFSNLKTKKSSYNIYIIALLLGGIVLLLMSTTDILVLGANRASKVYYPSHVAMSRVHIGNLKGVEIILSFVLLVGAFFKLTIHLLVCCKGIIKLFNFKDYKFIITPIALSMINLSYFLHDSIVDFFRWYFEVWPYYAFLFQVIIPITILIFVEVKRVHSTKVL